MYRFENFDELWARFKKDHPVMYEQHKNKEKPLLASQVFRENVHHCRSRRRMIQDVAAKAYMSCDEVAMVPLQSY